MSSLSTAFADEAFADAYAKTLIELQHDLSRMEASPIVSLATQAVEELKHAKKAGH